MRKSIFKSILAGLCLAAAVASFSSCNKDDKDSSSYSIQEDALGWWHAVDGEFIEPVNYDDESMGTVTYNVDSVWVNFTDITNLKLKGERWANFRGEVEMDSMGINGTIMNSTTAADIWVKYENGNPKATFTFTLTSATEAILEIVDYYSDGTQNPNYHEYYELRKLKSAPSWYASVSE